MSEQHGDITPAVRSALDAAKLEPIDSGARALAERYAALLDEPAPTRDLARSIQVVGDHVMATRYDLTDQQQRELATAWAKVSSALAEHSVASDLGPKLLAALTALGCTVAARKEAGGGGSKAPVINMPNPLQAARDAARERREHAAGS